MRCHIHWRFCYKVTAEILGKQIWLISWENIVRSFSSEKLDITFLDSFTLNGHSTYFARQYIIQWCRE